MHCCSALSAGIFRPQPASSLRAAARVMGCRREAAAVPTRTPPPLYGPSRNPEKLPAGFLACRRSRCFSTSSVLQSPGSGQRYRGSPDKPETASEQRPSALPPTPPFPSALPAKRKRSAGAKNSLRRVAVIAQQHPGSGVKGGAAVNSVNSVISVNGGNAGREKQPAAYADTPTESATPQPARAKKTASSSKRRQEEDGLDEEREDGSNVISAVCLAESFDMERVMTLLEASGYILDPDGCGFESHEVVHARRPWTGAEWTEGTESRDVDLFVFESGTLVGWGLPAEAVDALATETLVAAAADPFVARREAETLEFRRDEGREARASTMRGDVVVLGVQDENADMTSSSSSLGITRAQIAFSSGLARSTKLAVLESSLTTYFESTRQIPELLTKGASGFWNGWNRGLSQAFILQKTGELLSLRAQLNHYRELTDALPDIFWDARAELGLEGYYEQVGRALDVGVRIKTLNEKMDYAQEIATVLREVSSERHGARLEWIIIVLITVEVVFELRRVYLEWPGGGEKKAA